MSQNSDLRVPRISPRTRPCSGCGQVKPKKKPFHYYCVDCQVLLRLWSNIKSRCSNPNASGYERYGGRGIKVCATWAISFDAFYTWVVKHLGYRPAGHTFDRIDNDGNYEPGNVRWSTRHEQMRHTCSNVLSVELVREMRSLYASGEWTQMTLAKKYGISQGQVNKIVNNQMWQPDITT